MAAEMIRRTKVLKVLNRQIEMAENMLRAKSNDDYVSGRIDMLNELIEQLDIGLDELEESKVKTAISNRYFG